MTDSALDRVLRRAGGPEVLDTLADRLSGADLTTLLLAVYRRRAAGLRGGDVLRRYRSDRFTAPAQVPFARLRAAEDALIAALPGEFEWVTLSPVTPLGTHSVLGTVNQNKVISTIRATEVAADPTNGLALAAAARRASGGEDVRLAALQRVVRAQVFEGGYQPHFTLLALVSAGRDRGGLEFERRHLAEHLRHLAAGVRAAGIGTVDLGLTTMDSRYAPVAAEVAAALRGVSGLTVSDDPDRASGRGYYTGLSFKVYGPGQVELGDGGFVDWTRHLLGNAKERLLISGLGVDGLARLAERCRPDVENRGSAPSC